MKLNFDMQWQPVGDNMLWDLVEKAERDPTYTFAYTLGGQTTIYKHCEFESSRATCTCGFTRYTRKGYFKNKQIKDMKDHTKEQGNHSISITHGIIGYKK